MAPKNDKKNRTAKVRATISKNLTRILNESGFSQVDLAQGIGISKDAVNKAAKHGKGDYHTLNTICEGLDVDISELFLPPEAPRPLMRKIPVHGSFERTAYPPPGIPRPSAYMVPDDTMSPRYGMGDLVFIDIEIPADNGDFAVVFFPDGKWRVRQVFFFGENVILQSLNPFEPLLLTSPDIQAFKIAWSQIAQTT